VKLYAEIQSLAAYLSDGFATLEHADAYWGARDTVLSDRVTVFSRNDPSRQARAVYRVSDRGLDEVAR
jgi:hypothetical protein